jgi:hypothetical protein
LHHILRVNPDDVALLDLNASGALG